MRRRSKFNLVWGIIIVLALLSYALESIKAFGFLDLNAFAEFLMPGVLGFGIFIGSVVGVRSYAYRSKANSLEYGDSTTESEVPRKVPRKITRCFQCHKTLERHLGAICGLCKGIRCECGACFCGKGSLVRRK